MNPSDVYVQLARLGITVSTRVANGTMYVDWVAPRYLTKSGTLPVSFDPQHFTSKGALYDYSTTRRLARMFDLEGLKL